LRRAAASDLDNLGLQAQRMSVSLAQAEHKIYEANLTRILQDKLFEAESSKQGMSKEAFLEKELQGKVRDPLPAEIAAFYEQNKARLNKPLEQATAQIQQYLKTENRNRALGDLAARLKVEYAVSTSLPPLRLKVQTEGSPARGPEGAAVTLVEFSDFQCPYCLQLNKTLEEVLAKYGSDVRLVYRQLPLSDIHPFAEKAGEASLCAADQNRFWQMNRLIFETQNQLAEEDLKAKAAKLNLEPAVFQSCLASGKYASKIKQDQREAFALGIESTPALFINGRLIFGAVPLAEISRIVDEEIRLKASGKTAAASLNRGSE